MDIDDKYEELESYIVKLEQTFIAEHIPAKPEATPENYMFDVKSYCILSYAALEEYFETIALKVMDESIDCFLNGKLKKPLVAIMGCAKRRFEFNKEGNDKVFDQIKAILNDYKSQFSRDINSNHGVSILHLKKILNPVYLDLPSDVTLLNSLDRFTLDRGASAHMRSRRISAPEDVKGYVKDCLKIAADIKEQAKRLLS